MSTLNCASPWHLWSTICIAVSGTPLPLWDSEWRLYRSDNAFGDLQPTHLRRVTSVYTARRSFPLLLYLYYSTHSAICQALFLFFFAGGATRTHIIPLPTQPTTPATDGRTRLERVEWHTGGLSATDAHHLRFVPSLIFFREDTWREPRQKKSVDSNHHPFRPNL